MHTSLYRDCPGCRFPARPRNQHERMPDTRLASFCTPLKPSSGLISESFVFQFLLCVISILFSCHAGTKSSKTMTEVLVADDGTTRRGPLRCSGSGVLPSPVLPSPSAYNTTTLETDMPRFCARNCTTIWKYLLAIHRVARIYTHIHICCRLASPPESFHDVCLDISAADQLLTRV